MSDPAEVGADRRRGGDIRPGGPVRRLVFHAGLSVIASPLPGGLLVATRLTSAGRPVPALVTAGAALASTAALVLTAALLPLSAPVAALVMILIAAAGGAVTARLERRASMAPPTRAPGDRRLILRAVLWGMVVPVAWIPLATFIATMTSPWGAEVILKPSMQWRVLAAAGLWLAPLGVALGLARGLLERKFRIGAPLAFAATLPGIAVAFIPAVAVHDFVQEGLSLPGVSAWSRDFGGEILFYADLALGLFVLLAMAEYLCGCTGIRSFLLRCSILSGVIVCMVLHAGEVDSSLPVAARQRVAYQEAARGDDAGAMRSWRWVLRRAPRSEVTCSAVEQAAMAAIRAGRPADARAILERLDARLLADYPCAALGETARALLKTPLEAAGATAVEAAPIRPESYLDSTWSSVLTAVRAALPDLGETRLKDRLRTLSTDHRRIDLPTLDGFDDLRLMVRRLGCEAYAAPAGSIGALLAQGKPVLFRDPYWRSWRLLTWRAPGADAVIWLDYSLWDSGRERPLSRSELRQLLRGDDRLDPGRGAVYAETRSLGSESILRERLAADGGWVAVVVAAPAAAPEGADVALGDRLARLWQARHGAEKEAYHLAAGLAGRLDRGPASSEILAIERIGVAGRETPLPDERRAGPGNGRTRRAMRESPADSGLDAAAVDRLSPWALRKIVDLGESTHGVPCGLRRAALERLLRAQPDDTGVLESLLDQLLADGAGQGGDGGPAGEGEPSTVRVALDLAKAWGFDQTAVLRALEVSAPLAAESAEAKEAVAVLLRRLPRATGSRAEGRAAAFPVRARRSMAPYCAARAALSDRPGDALRWWRQAAEIDPLRADYRVRLAESLEQAGKKSEADRQRGAARELEEVSACRR